MFLMAKGGRFGYDMDQRGAWERPSCILVIVMYAVWIFGTSCLIKRTPSCVVLYQVLLKQLHGDAAGVVS